MARPKKNTAVKTWLFPLLAIPLIGLAVMFGFSAAILSHAGEHMPPGDIVAHLQSGNGVYGPALSPRILAFKEKLYEKTAPEIVAVGSSRIDQLRAEDFSAPFVNLSGAQTLDEASDIIRRLFDAAPPKALILALDDWWFLKDGNAAVTPRAPETEKSGANDLFTLASWYAAGDLTLSDMKTILAGGSPNIGIHAILHGDGFDAGGAYAWHSLWTAAEASTDANFKNSLDGVAHGSGVFAWGDNIDAGQWQKLSNLLDYLQRKKIQTFILLPPLAPTVRDAMAASDKYGYVEGFRMRMSEMAAAFRMPLFDDHDLRRVGATDCEFIDGVHPGGIALKRALLDMAVNDADIRARLKLPEIGWAIEHFRGQASASNGEKDFLGLGCQKPAPAPPVH